MIAGGKLTTYRVMARDAIDAAAHSLETTMNITVRDSITDRVPLVGAADFETRSNQRVMLSRRAGLHVARIDHLLGRFGGLVDDVLELCAASPGLAVPLEGADDYLVGGGGATPSRTRAPATSTTCSPAGPGSRSRPSTVASRPPRPVARLMAGELGWDDARTEDEVDHYLRRVEAERPEPGQAHRPGGRRGPGQRPRHRLRLALQSAADVSTVSSVTER